MNGPPSRPVRVFVGLGSNLGDRRAHLEAALAAIAATPGVELVSASPWIETDPVGGPPGQGRYLNGVAELLCRIPARALLERLLAIEASRGRRRGERGEARTLDLDLLLYGEARLDEPDLVVPHPRLEERVFVLQPLASLAPALRLPFSGLTPDRRLSELAGRGGER